MWSRIERSKNPFVHVLSQLARISTFRMTQPSGTPGHVLARLRHITKVHILDSTTMSSDYEYSDDEGDYYDEDDVMNIDEDGESEHDKEWAACSFRVRFGSV